MKQLYSLSILSLIYLNADSQNVGIGTSSPQQKLEVAGWVELGNESEGASGTAGAIRYHSIGKIQFHNGTAWIDLLSTNNSGDYIKNQNASAQTADFWISGTGQLDGDLTVGGNDIFGVSTGDILFNLNSRGGIRMKIDTDNDGSEDFAVQNGTGFNVFTVTEAGAFTANSNGTVDGNLTLTGTPRTLSSGDAFDISGSSGVDIIIDNNNDGTSASLDIKNNGTTNVLFSIPEDNRPAAYPYGTSAGNTGGIRFRELAANGGNFIALRAPDVVGTDYTFTLPSTDGGTNQVLKTDGAGILSWGAVSTLIGTDADLNDGLTVSYPDVDLNVNNGLSLNSDNVQLGGSLIQATTITQGNNTFTVANNGSANTVINLSGSGDLDVQDNGTSALFVRDDGYVGIGTNAPGYPLNVTKAYTGNWQARFSNNSSNVYLAHEGGYGVHINTGGTNSSSRYALEVRNASQTHAYFRDDGNVGIGSTAPSYKFTIGGTGGIFGVDNTASFAAKNSGGTYDTYFWPRWSDNIMYMNFGSGGFRLRNNGSYDAISLDDDRSVNIAKGVLFDCNDCGSTTTIDGSSNWGDLTIQGRVISTNSNLHLSPPGGYGVYINDDYRAAGGSSGSTFLDVDGYVTVGDPSSPSAQSNSTQMGIYFESFDVSDDVFDYWTHGNLCGKEGSWYIPWFSNGYMYWEHESDNDDDVAYSPWILIPTQIEANSLLVNWTMWVCTEGGYDGIRCEISINGGSWFFAGSYTSYSPGGSSSYNCGGSSNSSSWSGGSSNVVCSDNGTWYYPTFDLDANGAKPGDWVRFRLRASNDGSVETCCDDIEVYDFSVYGNLEQYSAGFQTGSLYAQGNIFANSTKLLGDVAEYFPVEGSSEPGDLIALNSSKPDSYLVSDLPYNPFIIGVHSTDPSILVNSPDAGEPVALTGRVPVKVTNENGEIKPGDFLTASSQRGYAMKAAKPCYVIGKALEPLNGKSGKILCLVEPSWYNPHAAGGTFASGNFVMKKGETKVKVNDSNMQQNSKVFVSMLTNPGSHYWISEKDNGSFTITLEQPSESDVRFDYFIEDAAAVKEVGETPVAQGNIETLTIDGKQVPKDIAEDKSSRENSAIAESRKLRTSSAAELKMTPPEVENPTSAYIWVPGKELKEMPLSPKK